MGPVAASLKMKTLNDNPYLEHENAIASDARAIAESLIVFISLCCFLFFYIFNKYR